MRKLIYVMILLLAASKAFCGGPNPIENLLLRNSANGNGQSFTNLNSISLTNIVFLGGSSGFMTNNQPLNATNLYGTINPLRLPSIVLTNNAPLNATNLFGTLQQAQLPAFVLTNNAPLNATNIYGNLQQGNLTLLNATNLFGFIQNANFPGTAVIAGTYTNTTITVDASGRLTAATSGSTGVGSGTVTSVALTAPADLTVGGSPVTTSGTLTLTANTQSANIVKAGPVSGGAATPTYRALVAADLPATAVTPGSYNAANITVDAAGRLTAAASSSSVGVQPNLAINGNFDVWNEGTSFPSLSSSGTVPAEMWVIGISTGGTALLTVTQETDVPNAQSTYSQKALAATAQASISAGDIFFVAHRIEGSQFRAIAQKAFTCSFYVKASKTGIFCVAFRNGGADRSYVSEVTINAANTWELKTITVSASPSGGTWHYDNQIGLETTFTLASGSTYQTTANAWNTGNFLATSNQANFVGVLNDYIMIDQFKIEPGSTATTYVPYSFYDELQKTLRYYYKTFTYATIPAQNAGATGAIENLATTTGTAGRENHIIFPVAMRTTPTFTTYNPGAANANWSDGGAPTIDLQTEKSFHIYSTGTPTLNTLGQIHVVAKARM